MSVDACEAFNRDENWRTASDARKLGDGGLVRRAIRWQPNRPAVEPRDLEGDHVRARHRCPGLVDRGWRWSFCAFESANAAAQSSLSIVDAIAATGTAVRAVRMQPEQKACGQLGDGTAPLPRRSRRMTHLCSREVIHSWIRIANMIWIWICALDPLARLFGARQRRQTYPSTRERSMHNPQDVPLTPIRPPTAKATVGPFLASRPGSFLTSA
jgi:hypothetical protein